MIATTFRRQMEGRRRHAFTLLEVLVVVAILVVLASVASVYVFGELDNAKKKKAMLQAKVLQDAIKNYVIKYDSSPPSLQSLVNPGNGEKALIEGGTEALKTPWGGDYQFKGEQRGDGNEQVVVITWEDGDGNPHQFPTK